MRNVPVKPHRKPLPLITNETPAFEVRGGWRPADDVLKAAQIIDNWRLYGKRISGNLLNDDGSPERPVVETIPGLVVKLFVRGGWVLMDDKKLYKLGLRSYPGT